MSSKWALVTGANGFLGARLVRQLVERGECVKALVRAGADLRELRDLPSSQVKLAQGDVRMCDRVYAALSGCDRMYHVAATYSVDERRGAEITADSAQGSDAALEAARRAGINKIVVTSSAATLGAAASPEPMDESASFNISEPNVYAAAKLAAEKVALARADAGMPIVVVNPGILVGPGDWKCTPSGQQIVNYLGYSPSFRLPVPAGGFSYVDVDDVAAGHIAAMENGRVGERYLLGGDNLTNREMFQLLSDVTGLAEPGAELSRAKANLVARFYEVYSAWRGEAPLLTTKLVDNYYGKYIFVDSAKAKRELGYSPRPSREAFVRSCRWFLDNGYVSKRAARRARLELLPS